MRATFIRGLSLFLITGVLFMAGCQQVVMKEDLAPVQGELTQPSAPTPPADFRVLKTESIVDRSSSKPRLTLFFLVENPNDFPRSFRSLRVKLYDKWGRYLGYQSWTTHSSPFIFSANSIVPFAASFAEIEEWQTAKVSFSTLSSPRQELVHQELIVLRGDLIESEGNTMAAITVQNYGSSTSNDIIVLVAGYDAEGNLVAWGAGSRQWRQLLAGNASTFETDVLQGDPSKIATVTTYISAYK